MADARPNDVGVPNANAAAMPPLRAVGFWPTDPNAFNDWWIDQEWARHGHGQTLAYIQPSAFEADTFLQTALIKWVAKAKANGQKVYVAAIPWNEDRDTLLKPEGWDTQYPGIPNPTWGDPEWVTEYQNWLLALFAVMEIDYLNIAVEYNMYRANVPADWTNFKSGYDSIRTAIKAAFPSLKVFGTLQYEVFKGIAPYLPGPAQPDSLTTEKLTQDVFGVSTYGRFGDDPYTLGMLPDNYYDDLAGETIFIGETGWYSSPSITVPSSLAAQRAFMHRLPVLLKSHTVEAVCWINMRDADPVPLPLPGFGSIGFLDYPGLAVKASWHEWLNAGRSHPIVIDCGEGIPAQDWTLTATAETYSAAWATDPLGGVWEDYVAGVDSTRMPAGASATTLARGEHFWDSGTLYVRMSDGAAPGDRVSVAETDYGVLSTEASDQYSRIRVLRARIGGALVTHATCELYHLEFSDCLHGLVLATGGDDVTMKNVATRNVRGFHITRAAGVGIDTSVVDSNRYDTGGAFDDQGSPLTLLQWQSATLLDESSTQGPTGLDADGVPTVGAAVQDAGEVIVGVSDVYEGAAPDIGAVEYVDQTPARLAAATAQE